MPVASGNATETQNTILLYNSFLEILGRLLCTYLQPPPCLSYYKNADCIISDVQMLFSQHKVDGDIS
jgi:hypothetical protein